MSQRNPEKESSSRPSRRLWLWPAVVIGLAAVVFGIVWLAGRPTDSHRPGPAIPLPEVTADDRAMGPADAPVTLVEYSDFQCPTCAFYHPFLKRLKEEFGDRLRFVYRHFPLVHTHAHAMLAAQAAEAAGRQGKFWEMHGLIFEGQKEWSAGPPREKFLEYAGKLGLERKRFEADLESDAVRESVERSRAEAERLALSGTPTFFINGVEIPLPQSYGEFRRLIESELSADG